MVRFLTHNRTFQVLKLNNNGLGVSGGTTVAKALAESARLSHQECKRSNLRVVVCGRNRLENGSAPVWAEAFAAHGGLIEVRLPQNGIGPEGIERLAAGLSKNANLRHLDLQDNTATVKGARAIAKALPSWPDLRILNLSDLLLKGQGGMALALVLGKGGNSKLETLKLQYGELDKRSLDILARAIHDHLPGLTTLELNGNMVDAEDECIENVREALKFHGHEDALDELDDMEEPGEEDDEEKDDEDDEDDKTELNEEEVAQKPNAVVDKATDALAELMGRVAIGGGSL